MPPATLASKDAIIKVRYPKIKGKLKQHVA